MERLDGPLLGLYATATRLGPERFQAAALTLLNQTIGFDRAWWGIMSDDRGIPVLRSSFRLELPDSFETQWEDMKQQDNLARDVRLRPRATVNFDEHSLRSTPGLAALNETHDLRHALCTSVFLPDKKSFLFVSLFRSRRSRGFREKEVRLKQALTPHLLASWRANLLWALSSQRSDAMRRDRSAGFTDRMGRVICADPAFFSMAAEGWPSRKDRELPAALTATCIEGRRRDAPNGIVRSEYRQVGGLTLIELRRTSPLERLTPRETEIARSYADARSYKDIASAMGISPATVRHHLRVIFEKLEIRDKTELVRLVDRFDATGLAPTCRLFNKVTPTESPIDCLGCDIF